MQYFGLQDKQNIWLCSTFICSSNGRVSCDELYSNYATECSSKNVDAIPKNILSKVLYQVFPNVKLSKLRANNGRRNVFSGITYVENIPMFGFVNLCDIQNFLDQQTILISKTDTTAKLGIVTNVIINGNILFKELTVDYSRKLWSLKVHGVNVEFEYLGITADFDGTLKNLKEIVHIAKVIRVCKGIAVEEKKAIPVKIISHKISSSDDDSEYLSMRHSTCRGVIKWISLGDACFKCRTNLCWFKNSDQNGLTNREETSDEDSCSSFDSVLPCISRDENTSEKPA